MEIPREYAGDDAMVPDPQRQSAGQPRCRGDELQISCVRRGSPPYTLGVMSHLTDAELLHRAASGSREALGEIARRYAGFVYSTALRQMHDPHQADDVTQAVFVILSQKISRLDRGTLLHGWFFTTTRYAAANAIKTHKRRMRHEENAAALRCETFEPPEATIEFLDDAIASLRQIDRSAVLLSYFGGRSWREVGEAIGLSEDAARKRVSRAVAQMRAFFSRRGRHLSTGAIAAELESAGRASAPTGLVESIASCTTAPVLSPSIGVGGIVSMMTWTNTKVAASFVTASLLTIGLAGAMVLYRASEQATAPATAPAAASASVSLKDDITVELMEVLDAQGGESWNGDGTPARRVNRDPDVRGAPAGVGAGPAKSLVIRIVAPDGHDFDARWSVKPTRVASFNHRRHGLERYVYVSFEPQEDHKTVNLRVEIATGEWKTSASREGTDGMVMTGTVAFGELYEVEGRCAMTISDELLDQQAQIVAIDLNGEERLASNRFSGVGNFFRQTSVEFDLPRNEIARIEFRTRPYDQWVEFKNVTLVPGQNRGFEVTSSGR